MAHWEWQEWTLGQDVMIEDMEQSKNIVYEYKIEKLTMNIKKNSILECIVYFLSF